MYFPVVSKGREYAVFETSFLDDEKTGRSPTTTGFLRLGRVFARGFTGNGHIGHRVVLDGTKLKIHNVPWRRTCYRRLRPFQPRNLFLTGFRFCLVANITKYGRRNLYFNSPVVVVWSGICNDITCYQYHCNLFYHLVFTSNNKWRVTVQKRRSTFGYI